MKNVWIFSAGIVTCNWLVILSVCITLMCTFDPTGRTFVKLKATRRRQRNLTTYTLRYSQALKILFFPLSLLCLQVKFYQNTSFILEWLTFTHIHSVVFCFFFALFSHIRHRLEEGQASSWSRRLKFFMCCTRAQDTQSVSHVKHYPFFFPLCWKLNRKGWKWNSVRSVEKALLDTSRLFCDAKLLFSFRYWQHKHIHLKYKY